MLLKMSLGTVLSIQSLSVALARDHCCCTARSSLYYSFLSLLLIRTRSIAAARDASLGDSVDTSVGSGLRAGGCTVRYSHEPLSTVSQALA